MEKIRGEDIGLSLVPHIGTLSSHSAQRTQTWHSHEGFELLFVTSGATSWEFQKAPKIDIAGGQFLVLPPRVLHRVESGMRAPSDVCGLQFAPECRDACKNSTFAKEDIRWLKDCFTTSALNVAPASRELLSRVERLVVTKSALELDPQNPLLKATMRTLACSVILEAARGLITSPPDSSTALVAAAKKFLAQNLREPVDMSVLVKHMGFSRSHLFAIFKSATGMTPNDYYLRLRIERAQQMLSNSEGSITDIALETGFSSSQYFSSVFRKYTGQSPMECRQKSKP